MQAQAQGGPQLQRNMVAGPTEERLLGPAPTLEDTQQRIGGGPAPPGGYTNNFPRLSTMYDQIQGLEGKDPSLWPKTTATVTPRQAMNERSKGYLDAALGPARQARIDDPGHKVYQDISGKSLDKALTAGTSPDVTRPGDKKHAVGMLSTSGYEPWSGAAGRVGDAIIKAGSYLFNEGMYVPGSPASAHPEASIFTKDHLQTRPGRTEEQTYNTIGEEMRHRMQFPAGAGRSFT